MTHVLVDPLFPCHFSRYVDSFLLRSRSLANSRVSKEELDRIRSNSRQSWKSQLDFDDYDRYQVSRISSYTAHYSGIGRNTSDCRAKSRPSSPSRRNRPHPPLPFLVWHHRSIPGLTKNETSEKDVPCKVGSKSNPETINQCKIVHRSLPNLSLSEKEEQILKATLSKTALPKAEAWLKQASTKDRTAVLAMLKSSADQKELQKKIDLMANPVARASLHRYLRKAGREETDAMARLMKTLSLDPYEVGQIDKSILNKQHPDRYCYGNKEASKMDKYATKELQT